MVQGSENQMVMVQMEMTVVFQNTQKQNPLKKVELEQIKIIRKLLLFLDQKLIKLDFQMNKLNNLTKKYN